MTFHFFFHSFQFKHFHSTILLEMRESNLHDKSTEEDNNNSTWKDPMPSYVPRGGGYCLLYIMRFVDRPTRINTQFVRSVSRI